MRSRGAGLGPLNVQNEMVVSVATNTGDCAGGVFFAVEIDEGEALKHTVSYPKQFAWQRALNNSLQNQCSGKLNQPLSFKSKDSLNPFIE